MSNKKTFTAKELKKLSSEEIISKIIYENYSLLETFGASKMRKEMIPIGQACHQVLNHFYRGAGPKSDHEKYIENAKNNIVKTLKKVSPATYNRADFPKNAEKGLVIGFNHPSLGEILRIIMMKVDIFGKSPMLFPVNLPWYEAIAKDYDRLKDVGIIITPTITPSTWKKIGLKENSEIYEPAQQIKRDFRNIYTKTSHDVVKNGGVILVAPSATRQATVFKTKQIYDKKEDIIPTMSILALNLYTDKDMDCSFLPLAILPPENFKRKLNLFKKYTLIPAKEITAKEIRKTYFKEKNPKRLENFDYDFHLKIAEKLPKKFWY